MQILSYRELLELNEKLESTILHLKKEKERNNNKYDKNDTK
jgi:hypothetical protein